MSEEINILKELYRRMELIRCVEETIAERYNEEQMRCPTHLSIGQEAVAAAVGVALRSDDYAVSTHRSHGHYLGKGGDVPKMIAEIYGKATGCSKGRGGSMHLIDTKVGFMGSTAIVSNSIPVGAGLGLSIQLNKTDQISCIFLGDAAVEEGVFSETVNFCAQRKLPVLFICENNFYSVYSPLEVRQPSKRSIAKMVNAMGVPSYDGDGNDAISIYKDVINLASKIRDKGGPAFIEYETYRWKEHCGPNYDNDIGYRTEEEFLSWKKKDPIPKMRDSLIEKSLVSDNEMLKIQELVKEEVLEAFNFAINSPYPDPQDAYENEYAK